MTRDERHPLVAQLTRQLQPVRAGEDDAIEHAAGIFNADLLVDMVDRACSREYRAGVEAVTVELVRRVVDEVMGLRTG